MIIKVTSYTRNRKAAKASIRYISHRPNMDKEQVSRPLFDFEDILEKLEIYKLIDQAPKGSVFYRIAFSPDPAKEDTYKDLNLRWLTQVSMYYLRNKLGKDIQFVASEHTDQSPVRHVNALVIVPGLLTKKEFRALPKYLKTAAATEAKLQRERLDPQPLMQEITQPDRPQQQTSAYQQLQVSEDVSQSVPYMPAHTCPDCGAAQSLWRVGESAYMCPNCGTHFEEIGINHGLQRESMQMSL
jgi:hypothetical protein